MRGKVLAGHIGGSVWQGEAVGEWYGLAKQLFEAAVGRHGFKPEQIFFDSTVSPLAIDMAMGLMGTFCRENRKPS